MSNALKNANLVLRSGKVGFYKTPNSNAYIRMQGFTSMSESKNPTEYERQYVDEDVKRTDLTGYNPAISYAIDRYKQDPVIQDLVTISEDELLGDDAVREIIQVDLTTAETSSNGLVTATGKRRLYAVVPDTSGDTTDCMTYTGNFKAQGEAETVTVTTSDNWQTIAVYGEKKQPVLKTLSVVNGTTSAALALTPKFSGTTTSYKVPSAASVQILATAEVSSYPILITYKGRSYNVSNTIAVSAGDFIAVTVSNGGVTSNDRRTYSIQVGDAS